MKKILLSCLAITLGFASIAQQAHVKLGRPVHKSQNQQEIAIEPVRENAVAPTVTPLNNGDSPNIVSTIVLGTSANAYGYGYAGGQKTMVWADDTLKAIVNIHRMGPGATPPSLSGYLAADKAVNMGVAESDWTLNYQIYNSIIPAATYVDAARYPQGALYSPPGNTSLDNAYITYFAPNLSTGTGSTWGGYSYGTCNWTNQADSTKHLYYYNDAVKTYIPDGMTIMQNGTSLVTDIETIQDGTTISYAGSLLIHRGVWNTTTNDYDYTLNQVLPFTTTDGIYPAAVKVAASPDNAHVWMAVLSNNGGTTQIGLGKTYYPILFHSLDGGLTWSDPISVQLDGPNGIDGIVNGLYTDYFLTQLFTPPTPAREEIPYTTAFDFDLAVDVWGNPHIGVVIGLAGDEDYNIYTGDSLLGVYDLYTTDKGSTWNGVKMGTPKTFDGVFGTLTEYNRTNIAITESGEKVVVTWLDTDVQGVTENTSPDVYARGFDLRTNMITTNGNGEPQPDNVTFLSEVYSVAYFQTTSHYLFTDGDDIIVPICTELLDPSLDDALPVTFYYIPDFKYTPSQFSIPSGGGVFPVGVSEKAKNIFVSVNPNPVSNGVAKIGLSVVKAVNANISVTNLMGQNVININRDLNAGSNNFDLSVSNLKSGVYFVTVSVNNEKSTIKMVIE